MRSCRDAKVKGERVEVWDTLLANFYVQIRESGVASYYVRYVVPGTNARRSLSIGDAIVLSVSEARGKAKRLLSQVAMGEDPGQERQQLRDCPSLEAVVNNYYLPHKSGQRSCRNDAAIFRIHVLPFIGKKKLSAITANEISDLQKRILARGCVPATANRPVVLIKHLFNLSMKIWQLPGVTNNPAAQVPLLKENSMRQVFLSEAQVATLFEAAKGETSCPDLLPIVALLLLTGARRMNVIEARWSEFDEEGARWTIPRTKSGRSQSVSLSNEALAVLKSLGSCGKSEYLFPNPKTGKPYKNIFNRWNATRIRAGLPHVRMHDLRHTFASLLINAGCSLFVVQKALGHHSPQMTMRYAHLADTTLQDAACKVGSAVGISLASVTGLTSAMSR